MGDGNWELGFSFLSPIMGLLEIQIFFKLVLVTILVTNFETTKNSDSTDFVLDNLSESSSDDEEEELLVANPNSDKSKSSPICTERNYTEFIIHHLNQLTQLDGILVNSMRKKLASDIYYSTFDDFNFHSSVSTSQVVPFTTNIFPSCSNYLKSNLSLLISREIGCFRPSHSPIIYPFVKPFDSPSCKILSAHLQPRQFEYHPTIPNLLVYGTTTGLLSLINTSSSSTKSLRNLDSLFVFFLFSPFPSLPFPIYYSPFVLFTPPQFPLLSFFSLIIFSLTLSLFPLSFSHSISQLSE